MCVQAFSKDFLRFLLCVCDPLCLSVSHSVVADSLDPMDHSLPGSSVHVKRFILQLSEAPRAEATLSMTVCKETRSASAGDHSIDMWLPLPGLGRQVQVG